jgi:putative PIN family toxin of toxin-antitoxin system
MELSKSRQLPAFPKLFLLLASQTVMVTPILVEQQICRDPDDDKFIACALSAGVDCIISGDKDLHAVRMPGLQVLTPRAFSEKYLDQAKK